MYSDDDLKSVPRVYLSYSCLTRGLQHLLSCPLISVTKNTPRDTPRGSTSALHSLQSSGRSLPRLSMGRTVSEGSGPRTASPRPDRKQLELEAGLDNIFRPQTPTPRLLRSQSRASIFSDCLSQCGTMDDIEVYHTITGGKKNPIAASRQPLPFAKITRRPARLAARMTAITGESREGCMSESRAGCLPEGGGALKDMAVEGGEGGRALVSCLVGGREGH